VVRFERGRLNQRQVNEIFDPFVSLVTECFSDDSGWGCSPGKSGSPSFSFSPANRKQHTDIWRGCLASLGRPLASVLQIENNHHAAHGLFVFHLPFASKPATVSEKQKPLSGWLFSA